MCDFDQAELAEYLAYLEAAEAAVVPRAHTEARSELNRRPTEAPEAAPAA